MLLYLSFVSISIRLSMEASRSNEEEEYYDDDDVLNSEYSNWE